MDRPRVHASPLAEPPVSAISAAESASLAVLLFAILLTLATFTFVIAAIAHA